MLLPAAVAPSAVLCKLTVAALEPLPSGAEDASTGRGTWPEE